jgi:hypothetical protein
MQTPENQTQNAAIDAELRQIIDEEIAKFDEDNFVPILPVRTTEREALKALPVLGSEADVVPMVKPFIIPLRWIV